MAEQIYALSQSGVYGQASGVYADALDTIPDSAIHQWQMDEGSGTTLYDNIGGADLTVNGSSWTSDSNATGGYKLSHDDTDDFESGSVNIDSYNELLIGVTLEASGSGYVISWSEDSGYSVIDLIYDGSTFTFQVGNGSSIVKVTSTTDISDGSKYRLQAWYVENSEIGVTINGNTAQNTTSFGTRGDPAADFAIGRRELKDSRYLGGDVDNPILYTDSSKSVREDDYQAQPWS